MRQSQKSTILKYLEENECITSMEAFKKFKITRLSAIIFCLREEGYDITTLNKKGKTGYYAAYKLED